MSNEINVTIEDSQPINITLVDTGSGYGGANDIYSNPPAGCYQIVNMYLNADLHFVVVYDDEAVE